MDLDLDLAPEKKKFLKERYRMQMFMQQVDRAVGKRETVAPAVGEDAEVVEEEVKESGREQSARVVEHAKIANYEEFLSGEYLSRRREKS